MSNGQSSQNPFAAARALRDGMLDAMSRTAISAVNTETFAAWMGAYLNTTLAMAAPIQRALDQYAQVALPLLNLPSRDEVAGVARRLTNIEMRLDDLDARLDGALAPPAAPATPAADPAIAERLAAIELRLDAILAAQAPREATVAPAEVARQIYAELQRVGKAAEVAGRIADGRLRAQVAQTPKQTVWTLNKASLYHYYPQAPAERRHRTPILLVFALINRPYIFDLRPGNSFVEHMLQQGHDVYLLDWGSPGPEDSGLTFEDYALEYLPRAIRAVQRHSGSREFTLLAWCIGALLSAIYAAVRPDDGLRNLLTLTAPLNFADRAAMGAFPRWLDPRFFNVDAILEQTGNMPGELIDMGNKLLKPVDNFLLNNLRLLDSLDDERVVESWLAMNAWVTDMVPFAGAAYRQLIVDFYRDNRLMAGTLRMRGEAVDLGRIRASFLNIIAEQDHIVPPCQSDGVLERVGSADKREIRQRGGHIGIMAGSAARRTLWPQIDAWLAERSR